MKNKIIDYIKRNRVSSTEIADALGKKGSIPNIHAINKGHFQVGNVFFIQAYAETNWHIHEQVQHAKSGDVVIIEAIECYDKALFGDLVSKYLFLYKQVSAIVALGNLRDIPHLIKENYPIWCSGYNPIGCHNEYVDIDFTQERFMASQEKFINSIAVCDDTGVVIIPKQFHNEKFFKALEFIEEQEDIWYDCIDRKKLSTFETVCLKKYLEE